MGQKKQTFNVREEAEPMPKRSRRPGETEQQAVTRRERNNEHMTVVRNNETVEQRSVRLEMHLAFAFASVGAQIRAPPGFGPYCFRVHGQICHLTGTLHPEEGEPRQYAQLYILDPDEANNRRMNEPANAACKSHVMARLMEVMRTNKFTEAYEMLHEVENRHTQQARAEGREPAQIQMAILHNRESDNRRYNTQACNEVAVVFSTMDGEPPLDRDLFEMHLAPFCVQGNLHNNILLMHVKAEANDLNWVRQNQTTIRAENYKTLVDHVGSVAEQEGLNPGKQIILPSSFQGSPRNMRQHYQDAMAIVQKLGTPDLFITMTCNPKWEEITENLRPNERPENRPDLVARVFKAKLSALLEDLIKKDVLGHVLAKVHVIEFQKRGLPHAHMLIILRAEDKPRTPALIDKVVSAEIPNKETHPRLFDVVTKNMIHGPCDQVDSRSPCLVLGKCSKGFPTQFQEETLANRNGYPLYKTRMTELIETDKNIKIDNSWAMTVPMFSFKLMKYRHMWIQDIRTVDAAIEKAQNKNSTLMAWFNLNQTDESAKNLKYYQVPEHYVFNKSQTIWTKRKQNHSKTIGRMYAVSMRENERFFLRLLLLHVPGAKSYDHLATVDNIKYPTFYEAAKALGLVTDETLWDDTLTEAAYASMPRQLRELFAYICIFGDCGNVSNLWTKHKENLSEDFARAHNHPAQDECELCESYALRDIADTLSTHSKRCSDFGLRNPPADLPLNVNDFADMEAERDAGDELIATLNEEQRLAFDTVENAINSENVNEAKCFFLDGPGGSGKTHLYKTMLSHLRGQGEKALPVASTGIAANLLKGGRTYHSQYSLPLNLDECSVSGIKMKSKEAEIIGKSKLLIWDESTRAPANALNCVDRLLKEIMGNKDVPFGGKVLLLGGDFRQTLPIIPHADPVAIVQASIKFSHLWRKFKVLKLNNNVRSLDLEYSDWLIKLGNGELTNGHGLNENLIEIPETMVASDNIVRDIFEDSLTPENVETFSSRAILCPTNADVDKSNDQVLDILIGDNKTYISTDSLMTDVDSDRDDYPVEFLNSLNPSGMPPHELKLKLN
ncbi:uncharacterized protein LOC110863154 [Folsomia candida]|uniref:uncharacterized protein LOC110863154 n=1 Tax=Folsomia candida TaxID=158441 RepID=UPI000B8F0C14|nr:uncharacterized protein LOC110863154 [Folsomia candida]